MLPMLMTRIFPEYVKLAAVADSGSPNGESKEEWWRQFLSEDGHLRFDEIVGLLPPPPQMNRKFPSSYNSVVKCAHMGVTSYSRRKGTEYELVAPVICSTLFHPDYFVVYHSNFSAKLKHTNSPIELFFAEMVACNVLQPGQDKAVKCSILTTQNRGRSSRGEQCHGPPNCHVSSSPAQGNLTQPIPDNPQSQPPKPTFTSDTPKAQSLHPFMIHPLPYTSSLLNTQSCVGSEQPFNSAEPSTFSS